MQNPSSQRAHHAECRSRVCNSRLVSAIGTGETLTLVLVSGPWHTDMAMCVYMHSASSRTNSVQLL